MRNNYAGLRFRRFSVRSPASVRLTKHVRIGIDRKLGYPRLMAYIQTGPQRRMDLYLISARAARFSRLRSNMNTVVDMVMVDIMCGLKTNTALASLAARYDAGLMTTVELRSRIERLLPLDYWLAQVYPPSNGPIVYSDLFDYEHDDKRSLTLLSLAGRRQQTVTLWPGLRVILESQGHYSRLSIYTYMAKGDVAQTVLATSLTPTYERARLQLSIAIEHYRDYVHPLPNALKRRIPLKQWLIAMQEGFASSGESPDPKITKANKLLTIPTTKGRERVNSMARWVISPSVMLAYWERIDRPALFLLTRKHPHIPKLAQTRISSVPVASVSDVRRLLIDAVARDLNNPDLNHGNLVNPLIDTDAMRKKQMGHFDIIQAVDALPLQAMVTFYDAAVLPTRLNGHRQRKYPDTDETMRWISHAGPESKTARRDCWWVLTGRQADGKGQVFPWGRDRYKALEKAKQWRDEIEAMASEYEVVMPLIAAHRSS